MGPDVYISETRRRKERKRRLVFLFIAIIVVYSVFLGLAWVIFRSPLFSIKEIKIEGNKTVSNDGIITLLQARIFRDLWIKRALSFENILIWPAGLTAGDLAVIPKLKNLTVEKNYFQKTVTVRVTERDPAGIWCFLKTRINADYTQTGADTGMENFQRSSASGQRESACYWFDDGGVLFEGAPRAEGNLIWVVDDYWGEGGLNAKILPDEFIPNLFSILRVLSKSGLSVKEVRLENLELQELKILTYPEAEQARYGAGDGPDIYFSLRFPSDNALAVINSLVENGSGTLKNLQYLDFRVENRAYYK